MLCRSVKRIGLAPAAAAVAADEVVLVEVVVAVAGAAEVVVEVVVDVDGAVDAAEVVVEAEGVDETVAEGGAADLVPEAEVGLDPLRDPPVDGRDDELPNNPGKAPKVRPPEARICISCC